MKYFLHLTRHLHAEDFKALLKCGGDEPNLYVYNHAQKAAIKPQKGQVNWIVEFLIGCFHKKHIFCSSKLATALKLSITKCVIVLFPCKLSFHVASVGFGQLAALAPAWRAFRVAPMRKTWT